MFAKRLRLTALYQTAMQTGLRTALLAMPAREREDLALLLDGEAVDFKKQRSDIKGEQDFFRRMAHRYTDAAYVLRHPESARYSAVRQSLSTIDLYDARLRKLRTQAAHGRETAETYHAGKAYVDDHE